MARSAASPSTPIKQRVTRGLQIISLQSPQDRLAFLGIVTVIVFILPYRVVGQFSLWPRLGWDDAPSIGLTRAYWLLLHGHPVQAWHRNWLIYVVLLIIAGIISHDLSQLKRGRKS